MSVFVKSLIISLLAGPALISGISACSSGATPIGAADRQKDYNSTQNEPEGSGTTEETSGYYGQSANQDFRGTVDSNLISAAYLACGKIDDNATEVGCNAYEPTNDERIPLEGNTNISWRVLVDGHPIDGNKINPNGQLISSLHLAMTAGIPRMLGLSDNRTVEVQICSRGAMSTQTPAPGISDLGTCDGSVLSTFRSTISKLPPAAALGAFGVAKNFTTKFFGLGLPPKIREETLTLVLKSANFDGTFNESEMLCRIDVDVPNFCLGNTYYRVNRGFSDVVLETSWDPRVKKITTDTDCDMIGRLIWTEICN